MKSYNFSGCASHPPFPYFPFSAFGFGDLSSHFEPVFGMGPQKLLC
jgi:hypothetical protein